MENQPKPLETYKNQHGTMKNQSGTIKTNLELDKVVLGGSGGYRRLPGGSDDFSLQTNTQTLHHNIYIILIILPTSPASFCGREPESLLLVAFHRKRGYITAMSLCQMFI